MNKIKRTLRVTCSNTGLANGGAQLSRQQDPTQMVYR